MHEESPFNGCNRGSDDQEIELLRLVDNLICGYIRQGGDDLSVRQLAVLLQVSQQSMEITPLAATLGLGLPAVSRCIDALEKLKLARRERKGRNVTVHVTPLGSARVGRLMTNAARAI